MPEPGPAEVAAAVHAEGDIAVRHPRHFVRGRTHQVHSPHGDRLTRTLPLAITTSSAATSTTAASIIVIAVGVDIEHQDFIPNAGAVQRSIIVHDSGIVIVTVEPTAALGITGQLLDPRDDGADGRCEVAQVESRSGSA
jgi:hypothetical protein